MSSNGPSPTATKRRHPVSRPRTTRTPSASEIARNVKNFETWSTHQCCEQVSYTDIPRDIKSDVDRIFDVTGRLPISWTDETSKEYALLSHLSTPSFLDFIRDAYKQCPSLFSSQPEGDESSPGLYAEVSIVLSAWQRLRWMRKSKEKWSEADYVANVYNVFRSPAIKESTQRVHCSMSLPQPLLLENMGTLASRIMNAKTVIPDCVVLIPEAATRSLSHSAKSPFKVLKAHSTIVKSGNTSKGTSFRYQSTPCATLPDTPGFEFASSFWEDKKPVHHLLEDAYRQNRMSTASALRHLHSLSIKAPVFGLVWSGGIVRAHVDWYKEGGVVPAILSAPFPGQSTAGEDIFREWQLDQASDIISVYFLIRNLDKWTNDGFRIRVVKGVKDLVNRVIDKGDVYTPWKRVGELGPLSKAAGKENMTVNISTTTSTSNTSQSTPLNSRSKMRRARLS